MTNRNSSELFASEPNLGLERSALETLQLERLRWTLHHAYANNPAYRRSFDSSGVRPDDLRALERLDALSVHHEGGLARGVSVRILRRPHGPDCTSACLIRYHRQTDRRRLYPGRHHDVEPSRRPLDPRRRRTARHESARRVRLRSIHGGPRRAYEHQTEAGLLAAKLKASIGITAEIRVLDSGTLRRSSGKAARVSDRRSGACRTGC